MTSSVNCGSGFAEDSFWTQSPACRGVSLSQEQSRMSHICHMNKHIHALKTKQLPCSYITNFADDHNISTRFERQRQKPRQICRLTNTRSGWRNDGVERAIFTGEPFFFLINKQLNMSVPQKSHQQSVRTTISGEMRSIYTVSPEARRPAQAYITYYDFFTFMNRTIKSRTSKERAYTVVLFYFDALKNKRN